MTEKDKKSNILWYVKNISNANFSVLLEHSHSHSFMYCLWLLSGCNENPERDPVALQSLKTLRSGPYIKSADLRYLVWLVMPLPLPSGKAEDRSQLKCMVTQVR